MYHVRATRFRGRAEVVLTRAEQPLAPHKLATLHELRNQIGSLHQGLVRTSARGKIPTRIDTFLKVHGCPPAKSLRGKRDDGETRARSVLTGRPPLAHAERGPLYATGPSVWQESIVTNFEGSQVAKEYFRESIFGEGKNVYTDRVTG
jgi:hypothetical protein